MDPAEIKRLAVKVDQFCTRNNIRDAEIAVSILDVLFGRRMGISPREVLGPVSDRYRTEVMKHVQLYLGVQ
jgi:hypothetical protein